VTCYWPCLSASLTCAPPCIASLLPHGTSVVRMPLVGRGVPGPHPRVADNLDNPRVLCYLGVGASRVFVSGASKVSALRCTLKIESMTSIWYQSIPR
jgi:hypothetical protein